MNELLEKYWEGTTTLEEEQRLKRYFASGNIDTAHEIYKPIFSAFALEKEASVPFDAFANVPYGAVKKDPKKTIFNSVQPVNWKSLAMAASIVAVIVLGAVYQEYHMPKKDLGTYKTPEEAYEATLGALQLMGTKINQNKTNLQEPMQTLQLKKKAIIHGEALRNTIDSLENDNNNNK